MIPILLVLIVVAVVVVGVDRRGTASSSVRTSFDSRRTPDAGTWSRDASMRIAFPLARAELRWMTLHPLVAVGVALTLLAMVTMVGRGEDVGDFGPFMALLVWPIAGLTLIAANLVAGRARRHGTEELFSSLPGSMEARTIAHSLSLAGPVGVAALTMVAMVAVARLTGGTGWPSLVDFAIGLALVACAGAVGVLLDRLAGRAILAPPLVLGIGILEGNLAGDRVGSTLHALAPWAPAPDLPSELWIRPSGWHLVYVIGILGVLVSTAVLRHRRSRAVVGAVVAAALLGSTAGWMQVQAPTRDQVTYATTFIAHPEKVQRCEQRESVRVCYYEGRAGLAAKWRRPIDGVLARVPAEVRSRPLLLRQRVPGHTLEQLGAEFLRALPFAIANDRPYLWPDDGVIHPEMKWCPKERWGDCEAQLASKIAAWAVGFPSAPKPAPGGDPEAPLTIAYDSRGQARAVVAMWLTGVATPGARGAMRPRPVEHGEDAGGGPGKSGSGSFRMSCDGYEEASVEFWPEDIAMARSLLRLPANDVSEVLRQHWKRLVDPRTTSAVIVDLFHLDPGRESGRTPIIGGC